MLSYSSKPPNVVDKELSSGSVRQLDLHLPGLPVFFCHSGAHTFSCPLFHSVHMFLMPPVSTCHALPGKMPSTPVLPIPRGSGKVLPPQTLFSGALRWPHPLLGTVFISTLPYFDSQDISLPKSDPVDPVCPLLLCSSTSCSGTLLSLYPCTPSRQFSDVT